MSVDEPPIGRDEGSLITDEVPSEDAAGPAEVLSIGPIAGPVESSARLDSVDVLRGAALLGILAMNIVQFGWPDAVYSTPTEAPGYSWADLALWMFNHIVFDTKMVTIFSMLFGAGLVLMSDRADARGESLRRIYYRRIGFLLLFGLVHSYLIWEGDILVSYACCGLFLYPFRRRAATTLIALGVVLLGMAIPVWLGGRWASNAMQRVTREVDAEVEAGKIPGPRQKEIRDFWKGVEKNLDPKPKAFEEKIRVRRGDYAGIVAERAEHLFLEQTAGFAVAIWWMVGGRMLLGMGLMKLGVFSAARSARFYGWLAIVGYGVGLPPILADIAIDWHYHFFTGQALRYFTGGWWLIHELSGPFVALGHVAVIMLIVRSGAIPRLARRLAAVGRMALTNYLMTSILCTTLFHGYGFGLYARLHRPGLYAITIIIWSLQLAISPLWLAHFRFGPAEWLWRSLTYGRPQPFLRDSA